jgi:hypothetical protein
MGDGTFYIRDGLHRVCLIHLLGRPVFEMEYSIEYQTCESFSQINLKCGWVTPFNPQTEVRKADFHHFKQEVMKMVEENKPDAYIKRFIESGKSCYCVPRGCHHTVECIACGLKVVTRREDA